MTAKHSNNRISVSMLSLGCPKTLVDSELILGMLDPNRYHIARELNGADVALLNTCTFIEGAKRESIDQVLDLIRLKKEGRIKAIVVLGCLVQRYQKELERELTEVDAFVGTGNYGSVGDVIDQVLQKKRVSQVGTPGFLHPASIGRIPLTPLYTRYVKISEGCDHVCTFCTIPLYRGRHRSRSLNDVIEEAKRLVQEGARELILTGQDTTFFGYDTEKRFLLPELLRALEEIEGLKWIRLLYAYPSLLSHAVIDAIAECSKVCHYVDLPLQHVSDSILRAMQRGTTKKMTYELIEKLRNRIPDIAIRTTFIVGFPGEGEREFQELLELMEFAQFDRLGIFTYSREEGSPAGQMQGQIPEQVKRKRYERGMQLQQKISLVRNKSLIGKTIEVLIEGKEPKKPNRYFGRSWRDAPEIDGTVYVRTAPEAPLSIGSFVSARICDASEYDLEADYLGRFTQSLTSRHCEEAELPKPLDFAVRQAHGSTFAHHPERFVSKDHPERSRGTRGEVLSAFCRSMKQSQDLRLPRPPKIAAGSQ